MIEVLLVFILTYGLIVLLFSILGMIPYIVLMLVGKKIFSKDEKKGETCKCNQAKN